MKAEKDVCKSYSRKMRTSSKKTRQTPLIETRNMFMLH